MKKNISKKSSMVNLILYHLPFIDGDFVIERRP